MKEKTVFFRKM